PSWAVIGFCAMSTGTPKLLRRQASQRQHGWLQETPGLLLAVEDTSTLRYSHHVSRELGPVGSARDSRIDGYLAHSELLLEAGSGATVGLVEQHLWSRPRQAHGQGHQRKQRAYANKESHQWQDAPQRVSERLSPTMTCPFR